MNTTASNARLHKMVGCALFAALTAVCSQLAIPMPWGVPINLALFAVYMAGTMLGPVWGAASQLVYLLLAAVGVPVMAGMQGGPAVLLGKTGGYAIGYLLAALIAGTFAAKLPRKFGWLALGCVVGCAACYVLGTIWFMVLTGLDLPTSLTYCVIPTARAVHQAAPPVAAVHRAAEAEAFNAENYLNFTENAVFSVWGRQKCRPLLM